MSSKKHLDSLLKLKKQELEKQQARLVHLSNEITEKMLEASRYQEEISLAYKPSNGRILDLKNMAEYKRVFLFEIQAIHTQISNLKKLQLAAKQEYQDISIEYEKLRYLQKIEYTKHSHSIKKREQKEIDEFSNSKKKYFL